MTRTALIANATETHTGPTTTTWGEVVNAVHVPEYWVRGGVKSEFPRLLTLTTDIEKARNVARNAVKYSGYDQDDVKIARRWLAVSRAA